MTESELTQVKTMEYAIKIFSGLDSTENITDDEVAKKIGQIINDNENNWNNNSVLRYTRQDEIGNYII